MILGPLSIFFSNNNSKINTAKNNGTNDTAKNSGTINLGKADGSTSHESLIGMFAQAESGKTASVKNTKDININTKKELFQKMEFHFRTVLLYFLFYIIFFN